MTHKHNHTHSYPFIYIHIHIRPWSPLPFFIVGTAINHLSGDEKKKEAKTIEFGNKCEFITHLKTKRACNKISNKLVIVSYYSQNPIFFIFIASNCHKVKQLNNFYPTRKAVVNASVSNRCVDFRVLNNKKLKLKTSLESR